MISGDDGFLPARKIRSSRLFVTTNGRIKIGSLIRNLKVDFQTLCRLLHCDSLIICLRFDSRYLHWGTSVPLRFKEFQRRQIAVATVGQTNNQTKSQSTNSELN
jgi:hypothetical protein